MTNKICIKICGMRDAENILLVSELQPDYMGFIFYPKSKRFVGEKFEMPKQLSKSIKRVGVFVNESTEQILNLAKAHHLDFIQLHGSESMKQCAELKENGLGVIKVFSVDRQLDFKETGSYEKHVDYFLFDTKSDSYGGTGKTFDWNLLSNYNQQIPFFLSGGLSTSNAHEIKQLKGMNLHALDVNSGAEISPGLKSIDKLKQLKNILTSYS